MFIPDAEPSEKMRELRSDFESCIDTNEDAYAESHRAGRYYHNTNGEGQWESDDLKYLKEQGRPALSFNVIAPIVNKFVGQLTERQRKAQAAAVGGEDAMAADVLNAIADRVTEMADMDGIDADVMKNGVIHSEHAVHIEVNKDPENPLHRKMKFTTIPFSEIHWDPASRRPDRSDARFCFWDKWLSKYEFARLYPDKDFEDLFRKADAEPTSEYERDHSERVEIDDVSSEGTYSSGRTYYNHHARKIRVIHSEYRVPKDKYFLIDEQRGISEEVPKGIFDRIDDIQLMGRLQGLTPVKTQVDSIHSVQWIGPDILYDDDLNQPYDGFSIVPFTYAIDSESRTAYGMVRNLFDPQSEMNKSKSLELESTAAQGKPGTISELSAIDDREAFKKEMRTSGGDAVVADGALTSGAITQRQPPQISPAAVQRSANAEQMIDKVSGVSTNDLTPGGQAEAFGTVQLRHRREQVSMADVVKNYERYQQGVKRRILQTIVRAFPDAQLVDYLGNQEKYQVRNGAVYEIDKSTGQPKGMVQLGKGGALRTLKWDVQVDSTSDNPQERLLEMQGLASLAQMGQPIDPVVMAEHATGNRATRERLKNYAEQMQQQQSQMAQGQMQQAQAQIGQTLQIEAGKAQETARHNQATEQLDYMKQVGDHAVKVAGVMEKADEGEKNAIIEIVKIVEQSQQRRLAGMGGR